MKIAVAGHLLPVPGFALRHLLGQEAARWRRRDGRLTPLEAEVRRLAVRHLPGAPDGGPLTAAEIAERGGFALSDVQTALATLHRAMGFLALDAAGDVLWAYPVTADRSPHYLAFETGERMTAA